MITNKQRSLRHNGREQQVFSPDDFNFFAWEWLRSYRPSIVLRGSADCHGSYTNLQRIRRSAQYVCPRARPPYIVEHALFLQVTYVVTNIARVQFLTLGACALVRAASRDRISMSFWEGHYNFSIHWKYTKLKCRKPTLRRNSPTDQFQLRWTRVMLPLTRSQRDAPCESQLREPLKKWGLGPKS